VFLLLIPYSIKTISRNFDWKNHYTLYSADIKYLGNSAKANELYASELSRQVNEDMLKTKDFERNRAKTELAIKHFKRSIEIDSSNYTANNNLGLIYFVLYKNNAEAIKYFKNSILYEPNYGRGNFNLAIVYENQKEFDSAIFYYQIVIRVDEKNQFAYTNLANIYFNEKNNIVKAIEINKKLMGEAPDNALPYINIGTYYLKIEDTVRSLQYFEQAAEKPNIEPNFLNALSKLYARKGQNDKSQYYYRKAVRAEQKRQKVKK
jgi:tetratricopeptide (TPR) repeat protein